MGTRGNSGGRSWGTRHTQTRWLIPFLLFVLAVVARTPALDRYVTPDELIWVYRSTRFREALLAGDWANTIQSGHPGVTTTWLGAAAMQTHLLLHPHDQTHLDWLNSLYWLSPDNDDAFRHLAVFLTATRWSVILATSLGLVGLWLLLRPLMGNAAANLSALFLIFDPFTAGLSGIFHVDALLGTFGLLAILCAVQGTWSSDDAAAKQRGPSVYPILAGIFTALAVLTKTPGVVLLLAVPVAWLITRPFTIHNLQFTLHNFLKFLLLWAGAGLLAALILLPALAAAPQQVIATIRGLNERLLETAVRPTFFWGEMTLEPGWGFYPVATALRLAPVVLPGIMLVLGAWLLRLYRKRAGELTRQHRVEITLVIFSLLFFLLLNLPEKKYDRYALPAIMPLIVVAASGWTRVLSFRFQVPGFPFTATPAPLALIVQLLFFATAWPYPLTAYNWLAGGTAVARQVLPMGWGEGASAAANFLREHTTDTTRPILTSSIPSVAPFYPGPVLRYHEDTLVQMSEPPYIILTEQDRQLNPDAETVDPATPLTLLTFPGAWGEEQVLRFNGLDRAWLYGPEVTGHLPLRPLTWQPAHFHFQQAVTLHQAGIIASAWPDPAYIGLEWSVQQPAPYQLQLAITDATGHSWSAQELPLLNEADQTATFWPPDERTLVYYRLPVPADVPPGDYQLTVTLFDGHGAQLGVFADDGRFVGIAAAPLAFTLTSPLSQPALNLPNPQPAGHVAGYEDLPGAIGTGEQLTLDVWWRVDAAALTTLTLQLGELSLPLSVDMTGWTPGHIVHLRPTWRIPVSAPTGSFSVAVNGVSLGHLTIEARDRQYELPAGVTPLAVQVGTLAFLQQAEVTVTGDSLTLAVIWQVNMPDGVAYTTFVHVRDGSGLNIDQQDRPPLIPTETWVEGQVIRDQFVFALPPAGVYTIALGLYQANGQRLPLYDAHGNSLGDEYRLEVMIP